VRRLPRADLGASLTRAREHITTCRLEDEASWSALDWCLDRFADKIIEAERERETNGGATLRWEGLLREAHGWLWLAGEVEYALTFDFIGTEPVLDALWPPPDTDIEHDARCRAGESAARDCLGADFQHFCETHGITLRTTTALRQVMVQETPAVYPPCSCGPSQPQAMGSGSPSLDSDLGWDREARGGPEKRTS